MIFSNLKCLVKFNSLEKWKHPNLDKKCYMYTFVTDADIRKMLDSSELEGFELKEHWCDLTNNSSVFEDNHIHLKVVAKMVQLFRTGEKPHPVVINSNNDISCYCVSDGHHRLRALKYMQAKEFLAKISGSEEDFKTLDFKRLD